MSIIPLYLSALLLVFSSCEKSDLASESPKTNSNFNVNTAALIQSVNKYRSSGCNCGTQYYPPVPAVKWNDKLAMAAAAHSVDMQNMNFLSHTGSNGSDAGVRLTTAGYIWRVWAENIAQGYPSEAAVMEGWINSPGHCENIMNPDVTEMGIARSGEYWTQVFGKPR